MARTRSELPTQATGGEEATGDGCECNDPCVRQREGDTTATGATGSIGNGRENRHL